MPTWGWVAAALLVGILLGWFFGFIHRLKFKININAIPPSAGGLSANRSFFSAKFTRVLNLKCKCGAEYKFREDAIPGREHEPFPAGGTFTCPQCGNVTDLKQIENLV
jgi:hypothetical protein